MSVVGLQLYWSYFILCCAMPCPLFLSCCKKRAALIYFWAERCSISTILSPYTTFSSSTSKYHIIWHFPAIKWKWKKSPSIFYILSISLVYTVYDPENRKGWMSHSWLFIKNYVKGSNQSTSRTATLSYFCSKSPFPRTTPFQLINDPLLGPAPNSRRSPSLRSSLH